MNNKLIDSLLHPKESYERTQALREAVIELQNNSFSSPQENVINFLRSYKTEDQVQAALVGILLHRLDRSKPPQIGVFARLFPALQMLWEPQIQKMAIEIFSGHSPKEVFYELTDMVALNEGSEEDRYYAYNVISTVDFDSVPETM